MEIISEDRIKAEHIKWLNKELQKQNKKEMKEYQLPYTKYSTNNEDFTRFDEETLSFYKSKFCKLFPTENGYLYNKLVIPLYENKKLINSAFRRVIASKIEPTNEIIKNGGHRPPQYFRYKDNSKGEIL